MLALARALAVSPKLIIADEMSLGLAPLVAESVFEGLEEARRSGITIVLSEQFVHRALAMADTCVILTRGRVGWSGRPPTPVRRSSTATWGRPKRRPPLALRTGYSDAPAQFVLTGRYTKQAVTQNEIGILTILIVGYHAAC